MTLKEFTIDLTAAPDELRDQIDQNEQAEEKLLQKVSEKFPDDPDSNEPSGFNHPEAATYEDKFNELREQRAQLTAQLDRIEEFVTDEDQAGGWSHHEFIFKEPSTEDALYIEGRSSALADEAEKRGEQIDERMFGVTELLERIRVDAPPEAPDNLTGELPQMVGEWLLDALNEKSTGANAADLGNLSPQEALKNYESSQRS